MTVRAVYFDIGETVLDRTREWAAVADVLGVPRHTFSAVFGGMVARGGGIRETLALFTGRDWADLRRTAAVPPVAEDDLYDDVRPCLVALAAAGLRVGVVGNQPADVAAELRALDLPAATVATSAQWGVAKPDPAFFARVVDDAGVPAGEVVYVGDQPAADLRPALAAGMLAVRLRRGPWGHLVDDPDVDARCLAVLTDLRELPEVVLGG